MPFFSRASTSRGRFMVMKPASAPYLRWMWWAKAGKTSSSPRPSRRSVTTFWTKITGVFTPAKRFISASTRISISL